ncbi:MAG: hypothetical protein PHR35_06945 [Kiritimatiellae bacterium]|nr:hypothetical protein [Kiritimatiellia bacterium]
MNKLRGSNGLLTVTIGVSECADGPEYHIQAIQVTTPQGPRRVLEGEPGREFVTSLGGIAASTCGARQRSDGTWEATLSGKTDAWEASETITLAPGQPYLRRVQTYRFTREVEGAICPGLRLRAEPQLRYTYPLRAWEQPLAGLSPLRACVDWALPFPFHVWHDDTFVALYGLDKTVSPGTIEFAPADSGASAALRVYFPDSHPAPNAYSRAIDTMPVTTRFAVGTVLTFHEIVAAKPLVAGDEALMEAERIASAILLRTPPPAVDLAKVADGIAGFYKHCELWEPDALGPERGWFSNMWVRTQTGPAKKRGEMTGYFDLGWGEGIAVEAMLGMVRHWARTGDASLLPYVDEMSRNMELFKRAPGDDQPYFDRTDGKRYGDFLMDHVPGNRIWTHSLGHTGSQLLQLYREAPDYPNASTREAWLAAARSMAAYFARNQKPNGDLNDIFDDKDREANTKPHRIAARVVVCGLWVRLGQVSGETVWTECARRLAAAVAPEIERCEHYNQMLDGIVSSTVEYTDGEALYYLLEGLVPLYAATRDDTLLRLCKRAAALGIAWTYFYDVPQAHRGIARGGQCCRMDDLPLLYPIGPAKAMTPLLELYALTGDEWFETMAREAATFIGHWQMKAPGCPWDGGMIHALGQYCNKHWGPDLAGQVDTGMATGNSLAALESWLTHLAAKGR